MSPDSSDELIADIVEIAIEHHLSGFICGNTTISRDSFAHSRRPDYANRQWRSERQTFEAAGFESLFARGKAEACWSAGYRLWWRIERS